MVRHDAPYRGRFGVRPWAMRCSPERSAAIDGVNGCFALYGRVHPMEGSAGYGGSSADPNAVTRCFRLSDVMLPVRRIDPFDGSAAASRCATFRIRGSNAFRTTEGTAPDDGSSHASDPTTSCPPIEAMTPSVPERAALDRVDTRRRPTKAPLPTRSSSLSRRRHAPSAPSLLCALQKQWVRGFTCPAPSMRGHGPSAVPLAALARRRKSTGNEKKFLRRFAKPQGAGINGVKGGRQGASRLPGRSLLTQPATPNRNGEPSWPPAPRSTVFSSSPPSRSSSTAPSSFFPRSHRSPSGVRT